MGAVPIIIIYIVLIVAGLSRSAKKKQQSGPGQNGAVRPRTTGGPAPDKVSPWTGQTQSARQASAGISPWTGKAQPAPQAPAAQPAPRPEPLAGSLSGYTPQGKDPCHDDYASLPTGSLSGYTPQGKDPCHDDYAAMPTGSLGGESPEGKDPCHDDWQRAEAEAQDLEAAPAGGLNLSWTGDEIVRGFVLGEILRKRA